jgi:hypothetical protein
MRTAFTPQTKTTRQWVPQKMTCTVPCTRKVAVNGMKQVTYNVTQMMPHQVTRKVAVNKTRYVDQEVTVMKPVTVAKRMQVGTRVTYAPSTGTNGGRTALQPTADPAASARNPNGTPEREARRGTNLDEFSPNLDPDAINRRPATNGTQGSYRPSPSYLNPGPVNAVSKSISPTPRDDLQEEVVAAKHATPSVIRVSHWVARASSPVTPVVAKAGAITLATSTH